MKKIISFIIILLGILISVLFIREQVKKYYFEKAEECYEDGELNKAVKLIKRGREWGWGDAKNFKLIGEINLDIKDYDRAIKAYETATKLDSNNPELFYKLAFVYTKKNEKEKALMNYKKVIEMDPYYKQAYVGTAILGESITTAKGGGLKFRLKAEFLLLSFFLALLILLVLHISLYFLFIQPECAYTIPSRPKMVTPIWLLLHIRIPLKHLDRRFPLQHPHHFRYRILRRDHHDYMHVILLNIQRLQLQIFPLAQHPYACLYKLHFLLQHHSIPILRTPYNVIFATVDSM